MPEEIKFNQICEDVIILKEGQKSLQKCYDNVIGDTKDIKEDIKEIREKLLSRPTWFITILITFLSSLSLSLIIYIVTNN